MLWIVPAWIISLLATFYAGYRYRDLLKTIEILEQKLDNKTLPEPEPEVVSQLIDPLDPVATAVYEREQFLKKLNP